MRFLIIFCAFFVYTSAHASDYTIPQKFRGRYKCEVPSYEMKHDGKVIQVAALTAILFVYKTKIIIRIGDRSFTSNVEKIEASRNNPLYRAEFPAPLKSCEVRFNRKNKSVLIDIPLFQGFDFVRIR